MIDFIQEIIERASVDIPQKLSGEDVQRWSEGMERKEFYDAVSLEIAQRYHTGSLSYHVCDAIINDLYFVAMSGPDHAMISHRFYQVFLAFDAGEYSRTPEQTDDPETDFTKPMIAAILSKLDEEGR